MDKNLFEVIPEIFYDLIARIIPGSIIIVYIYTYTNIIKIENSFVDLFGQFGIFIIFFLLSYATGLIFDLLGDIFNEIIIIGLRKILRFLKKNESIKKYLKLEVFTGNEIIQEIRSNKNESIKPVLLKILAEKVFFRSLTLFFLYSIYFSNCKNVFEVTIASVVLFIVTLRMENKLYVRAGLLGEKK